MNLTIEQMKSMGGLFKFVVVNGRYRFFDHNDDHEFHVGSDEKCQGAGIFAVMNFPGNDSPSYIRMESSYSSTLKISCWDWQWQMIATLFQLSVCHDYGEVYKNFAKVGTHMLKSVRETIVEASPST